MSSGKPFPDMPTYPTDRLVGIELEIDSVRQTLNLPRVEGWSTHHDGSLSSNGQEVVLEPPLTLPQAVPKVEELCRQLVDINVHKAGGFHCHVQVADYTPHDAYSLLSLYRHFEPSLNELVGSSRVGNRFCKPFKVDATQQWMVDNFCLNRTVAERVQARSIGDSRYYVVNFSNMRCTTPTDRSVEFRQGSISKRAINVIGWVTTMVALVDIARGYPVLSRSASKAANWREFISLLKLHEAQVGATGVADWVAWRKSYLYGMPKDDDVTRVAREIGSSYRGVFYISRMLNTNLAYAQRVLTVAADRGLLKRHPSKALWMAAYDNVAAADLAMLEQLGSMPVEEAILDEVQAEALPST